MKTLRKRFVNVLNICLAIFIILGNSYASDTDTIVFTVEPRFQGDNNSTYVAWTRNEEDSRFKLQAIYQNPETENERVIYTQELRESFTRLDKRIFAEFKDGDKAFLKVLEIGASNNVIGESDIISVPSDWDAWEEVHNWVCTGKRLPTQSYPNRPYTWRLSLLVDPDFPDPHKIALQTNCCTYEYLSQQQYDNLSPFNQSLRVDVINNVQKSDGYVNKFCDKLQGTIHKLPVGMVPWSQYLYETTASYQASDAQFQIDWAIDQFNFNSNNMEYNPNTGQNESIISPLLECQTVSCTGPTGGPGGSPINDGTLPHEGFFLGFLECYNISEFDEDLSGGNDWYVVDIENYLVTEDNLSFIFNILGEGCDGGDFDPSPGNGNGNGSGNGNGVGNSNKPSLPDDASLNNGFTVGEINNNIYSMSINRIDSGNMEPIILDPEDILKVKGKNYVAPPNLGLESGLYRFSITFSNKRSLTYLFDHDVKDYIPITNSDFVEVTVFPNPIVDDKLEFKIESEKNMMFEIQILNFNGDVLHKEKKQIRENGEIFRSVNVSYDRMPYNNLILNVVFEDGSYIQKQVMRP